MKEWVFFARGVSYSSALEKNFLNLAYNLLVDIK